jgi:hypothetical protein
MSGIREPVGYFLAKLFKTKNLTLLSLERATLIVDG